MAKIKPKYDTEKRRQHVYDLCVIKHQPIEAVAEAMKVPARTIKADITLLNKRMAKEMMKLGHEQLLVSLIEEQTQQKKRIFKYLSDYNLHDTARAKYESILMENAKLQERFFDKLAGIATRTRDRTLEDDLASMSFQRFNEYIGYPLHPFKKLPQKMTQAQLMVFEHVNPQARSWIALNKSRQWGATEVVLRILAYYAFSKYRNKKIAIVAGTRIETTIEIFNRLVNLFRNIGETVKELGADVLRLKNGTSFHVVPASKNAINGWTGFGAFLLDESSFWNLEADHVILDAFLPIARTNKSDVFMISNPNGPRGFFYHIIEAPSPSWTKMEVNIWEGGKELYTKEEIQEMIDSSDEDPASSYLCKFVGGRDSVFGDLDEKDMTEIYEAKSFD